VTVKPSIFLVTLFKMKIDMKNNFRCWRHAAAEEHVIYIQLRRCHLQRSAMVSAARFSLSDATVATLAQQSVFRFQCTTVSVESLYVLLRLSGLNK